MVVEAALLVAASLLLVPTAVLLVEVIAALRFRRAIASDDGLRPPIAVLVPAHDEAALIGGTIGSLRSQLAAGDRLVVVADNCTDATARISAAAGAEVVERTDPLRRGKGYAIDFGVRQLELDPRPVVIVVDADCTIETGALDRLAARALKADAPVQALDLMRVPERAGPVLRIAAFAWIVRNHVRPLGLHVLGFPCLLMGTGMAFPWKQLRSASLASGELVEDMKLGIELARAGWATRFCPEAIVRSEFPMAADAQASQRTRWEHGQLRMLFGEVPRLLVDAIAKRRIDLLALALELCVPPLALLALLVAGILAASLGVSAIGGAGPASWTAAAAAALLGAAVLIAWARFGRDTISLGQLLLVPLYVVRKLPIYLAFLVRRQTKWVRTRRGGP